MSDKLLLEDGQLLLTTEEGEQLTLPETKLEEMMRHEFEPPVCGVALPDGVKFLAWQPPFFGVVHQRPALVQMVRWIRDDSPAPFGPGTAFQTRRLSMPYAITFALYCEHKGRLALTSCNELYFRNEPLRSLKDRLGYPALLNVSRIDTGGRNRAWICTQYLRSTPGAPWDEQLAALLNHTWNGAFNLSSEHHEGASWYGESREVHPELHPIEHWEQATARNDRFALGVPWKPCSLDVGQLLRAMLEECRAAADNSPLRRRTRAAPAAAHLPSRLLRFVQQASGQKS